MDKNRYDEIRAAARQRIENRKTQPVHETVVTETETVKVNSIDELFELARKD